MDLACRREIYCGPSVATFGVTVKTPLSARRSTHQTPLCHSDRGPRERVYKTDRKKCKLREKGGIQSCRAVWKEKIALSAAIFHADGSSEGKTKISSVFKQKTTSWKKKIRPVLIFKQDLAK